MYARISLSMYVCVWYFHKIFIKIFNYLRIKNLENVCLFVFFPEWLVRPFRVNYFIMPSVQFSHSVMSNSWWLHEPQHTGPPCPSPTPGVYSNSWPLSPWCHSTISSSFVALSSCPQSFPASESFQMSQFFVSGGQRIGVSASASVFLMNA